MKQEFFSTRIEKRKVFCNSLAGLKKWILVIAVGFLFAQIGSMAKAEEVLIDEIVAVVNDQAITVSDLKKEINLIKKEWRTSNLSPNQVLQRLIDDEIIQQEAERRGLKVTEKEVDALIVQVRGDLSEEEFSWTLKEKGLSTEDFRERMKHRIIHDKLLSQKLKEIDDYETKVSPEAVSKFCAVIRNYLRGADNTSAEVLQFYEIYKEKLSQTEKVKIAQIVVRSKETAEEILQRLKAGESFSALAKSFSVDSSAKKGGDLDWFDPRQIQPLLRQQIVSLEKNGVSSVLPIQKGYFRILKLLDEKQLSCPDWEKEIVDFLQKNKLKDNLDQWLEQLKKSAEITIRPINIG